MQQVKPQLNKRHQDKARADANKSAMVVAQKERRDKNPSAPKSIAKSGTSKDVQDLKKIVYLISWWFLG